MLRRMTGVAVPLVCVVLLGCGRVDSPSVLASDGGSAGGGPLGSLPGVMAVQPDHRGIAAGEVVHRYPGLDDKEFLLGSLAQTADPNVVIVDAISADDRCTSRVLEWNLRSGARRQIGHGFMPFTSADGNKLAFVGIDVAADCRQDSLQLKSLPTGASTTIVAPLRTETGSGQIQPPIAWAPDNSAIAFGTTNGDLLVLDTSARSQDLHSSAQRYPRPAEGLQKPVWGSGGLRVIAIGSETATLRHFDPVSGLRGESVADVAMDHVYDSAEGGLVLYAAPGEAYPSVLRPDGTIMSLDPYADHSSPQFVREAR